MLQSAAAAAINHLLRAEQWARDRLASFAGRTVRFALAPAPDLALRIDPQGLVVVADETPPDVVLVIRPATLPRLLAHDESAVRDVEVRGDTELASAVQFLFRNLRWDVERDLAGVMGDAAAHRLASTGRAFADWQKDAATRLAENVAEFLTHEARLLASSADAAQFGKEVDELRDAVDRLEARLARLEVTSPPKPE